jgi:mannose-1-phosphate guanylyltransferase
METAFRSFGTKEFPGRLRAAYRRIPAVSVDYGILEKEEGILVIPADFGWSDLGTWRSLHEFLGKPGENITSGNVILSNCGNVFARSDRGLIAVVGMEDLVVVRSRDAVLICPRSRSEEVKRIAEEVRRKLPAFA